MSKVENIPLDTTQEVLLEVEGERLKQDEKWGKDRNHTPPEWLMILGEEVGEANQAALEWYFSKKPHFQDIRIHQLREELIQVAAVAVAFIESLDRNEIPAIRKERDLDHEADKV